MPDPITTLVTEHVTGYNVTGFHGEAIGIELKGADEVLQKIAAALISARKQAAGSLYRLSEEMMTEAKARTPVDTGNLRDSGHASVPDESDPEIQVVMGFGGPAGAGTLGASNTEDVGYAIIVHEDLEAFHKVGDAKFLESVMREYAPYVLERVAKGITL